ncbi:MAG: O-antigen ligase family protein [Oscillospiraceae bacterium]
MRTAIRIHPPRKLKLSQIGEITLFLYLCIPFLRLVFQYILVQFHLTSGGVFLANLVAFTPYVLACIKARRLLIPDFWGLVLVVVLFFMVTYIFHPEYAYWYFREDYGVINYVLRPNNGLFIYLAIRLIDDPKKIIRCIQYAGWVMLIYYGRQLVEALARGYWIDNSSFGYVRKMSYNLSFGYNILLYGIAFLYCALEKKKITDIAGTVIYLTMILVGGSRGPFLDIAVFLLIYILLKFANSKKKIVFFAVFGVCGILLIAALPYILSFLEDILSKLGIHSRFITKLISGNISDDAGRISIYLAAINMIKSNPFGYGAMGSRHVIFEYIYVAHPHQIFLELLIDFGVFAGSLIILWLAVSITRVFLMKNIGEWKYAFLIFFARFLQLLVSLTYWHSIGLWSILAVMVQIGRYRKKQKTLAASQSEENRTKEDIHNGQFQDQQCVKKLYSESAV